MLIGDTILCKFRIIVRKRNNNTEGDDTQLRGRRKKIHLWLK